MNLHSLKLRFQLRPTYHLRLMSSEDDRDSNSESDDGSGAQKQEEKKKDAETDSMDSKG